MSIEEYNKRNKYIKEQPKEVQKWLKPRVCEQAFWLIVKSMKDG